MRTSKDIFPETYGTAKPYVILMVGVNGVGKTTSIGKLAHHFTESGRKVVLGAADTFRAAAAEQLEILGDRVGVDVIRHAAGADPGAVAYDSYQASKARGADILIIDTAGTAPHQVQSYGGAPQDSPGSQAAGRNRPPRGDSHAGRNDWPQRAGSGEVVRGGSGLHRNFPSQAGRNGKRGGIVLAIRQELQVPILFIGTGEGMADFAPFDADDFVDALLEPVS